jgi:alanine dehydrogenase
MKIGVPKETLRHEHRVGLTPFGVSRLTNLGHEVFIERDAGKDAHFENEDFAKVGAKIVYSAEEAYGRADIVCRVSALSSDEANLLRPESTVCGFHHLAVAPREVVQKVVERRVSMIGYEIVQDTKGERPILAALSEIAGHMVVQTAGHLLETGQGGRGVILGGVPGIAPATIVILGAGTAGRTAADQFMGIGAHVILMDNDLDKLRLAASRTSHDLVTLVASPRNLTRFTAIADVLVGAVLVPGARAPFLVTEEMVRNMKPGSAILDLSIDQGGCVETSRPTTSDHPTFKVQGVTHYCVPNMTTNAPRTASRAMALAAQSLLLRLAEEGLETALRSDPGLAKGCYLYRGRMVNETAASALGIAPARLSDLLS